MDSSEFKMMEKVTGKIPCYLSSEIMEINSELFLFLKWQHYIAHVNDGCKETIYFGFCIAE